MKVSFEVPDQILHELLDHVPIPAMARVHQVIATPAALPNVEQAVAEQLRRPDIADLIRPGQRIAVGVGSRGIARLPEIVAALVTGLRALDADPFIVPTMGSHGGATAGGQAEVLDHLGVTEQRVGAPVHSSMDTVEVGRTPDGIPVHIDRLALTADGIVFIARVKPHTGFRGRYESGLTKMIAIGLGKQAGAAACHNGGFGDMARRVPLMAGIAIAHAPIRFGLAILENAHDEPYKIHAVPADRILADEPALQAESKAAMPAIPFPEFDVLIIDEIGKNISGDGADPNITGRYATAYATGGPRVNKQVVLDLTDVSDGNAAGIGTADFTTVRAARKFAWGQTYPNGITATILRSSALPMVLPSDRLAYAAAILTCNAVQREPRIVRIANTLQLEEFWISTALLAEVRDNPAIQVVRTAQAVPFDDNGNLPELSGASGKSILYL